MWWNHGDFSWGAWLVMAASMVAFWGLVIWAVIALVRSEGARGHANEPTPEAILSSRLAKGEIDVSDYTRTLAALRQPGSPDPSRHDSIDANQ
jgi:putative membrane protein